MFFVERLFQHLVMSDTQQARKIAEELGKKYQTLLKEVNPSNNRAKLGLDTAYKIMVITGDSTPLAYMAKELGYELVPKDE